MKDLKQLESKLEDKMKQEMILQEISKLMEVDRSQLNINTPLEQYATWDSLTAVSLIALIDSHFQILLTSFDLGECKTLNEIFKLVEGKLIINAA